MSTIYTRATKGSALTWTEGDANINNLNNDKIEDIVEDTTPQLGGDLDVNGHSIVSTSNGNIAIVPNGTGNIQLTPASGKITLGATDWPAGPGSAGQVLTTAGGTGVLSWETPAAGGGDIVDDTTPQLGGDLDVNGHSIVSASNGNIAIVPNGTGNIQLTPASGKITLGALDFPTGMGTNGQVLTTNGSSAMTWTTVSGGATNLDGLSDVAITGATIGEVLQYNGTNWVDVSPSVLSVGEASVASTVSLTGDSTTNATRYMLFAETTVGDVSPKTDSGLTYNPSTGVLTSTTFVGSLTGNASSASTVTLTADNTTNATNYPTFVNAATGNLSPRTDTGFTYNPSTGTLTATSFSGSATNAVGVSITDNTSSTGTWYPTFVTNSSGTGNALNVTSGRLSFVPNTGVLTTTALVVSTTATLKDIRETVSALSYVATITPNAADGSIRTITLTGNLTFSAFASPVSGQSITLIITQDATGSRTLTSTMKFAGGLKTLSTAANSIDILTVSYIGTTYYASLAKGFA